MKAIFDVIIVGGSYAGLSAAMALGRSLKKVLIIDSGMPCNIQTPHSHNFITQDGVKPGEIAKKAKEQVLKYDTINFHQGIAKEGRRTEQGFEIKTELGDTFVSRKLLFATGLQDLFPPIPGFSDSWGISVLHCPYCHGYEVRNRPLGVLANGDVAFEFCRLISNWSPQLTLFTNGKSTLTREQAAILLKHKISIVEKEIAAIENLSGNMHHLVFSDQTKQEMEVLFAKIAFKQKCDIPILLGCELTEHGFLKVDEFQRTTEKGIYAAGDNTSLFRAVSMAVAAGTKAGAIINKELIEEIF